MRTFVVFLRRLTQPPFMTNDFEELRFFVVVFVWLNEGTNGRDKLRIKQKPRFVRNLQVNQARHSMPLKNEQVNCE